MRQNNQFNHNNMKKIIFQLLIILASVSYTSCEKQEQPDIEGNVPVEASKEVTEFFNENLPSAFQSVCPDISVNQACMMVVNDMEELGKIFTSIQLPEIDFEKYTFVACMFQASAPKYIFRKQAVVEESQKVVLNILMEEIKEGAFPTIYQSYYFWGLYDKLPEKPVTANITVF